MMPKAVKIAGLVIVAIAVVVAVLFSALPAFAHPGNPGSGPGGGPYGGWMAQYRDEWHAALAELLGMSVQEFEEAMAQGKTPWQLAEERGIDLDEFREGMLDAFKKILAQAVADGVLTQEQANWMLEEMEEHLEDGEWPYGGPYGSGGRGRCPHYP